MKRGALLSQSIFILTGAAALASNAHADTIVHTTQFIQDIIVETDTFETSGGGALFATNGVGYSDWLGPIIASELAGDSTVPAQIQSTATLVATASDYQFLAGQGPQYIVLGGIGPAVLDTYPDQYLPAGVAYALAAAGGPGYSIVGSPVITTIGQWTYNDGAIEPDGSLLEGTVTFDVYDESIVEQPVAPSPEPSTLALLGSGLAMLLLLARRKAVGGLK